MLPPPRLSVLVLGALASLHCGAAPSGTDGGPTTDAGAGGISTTGTIGGTAATMKSGFARVDRVSAGAPSDGLLVILTDQSPWACPSTASQVLKPNEVSINFSIQVVDGGVLTGTFPFAYRPASHVGVAVGNGYAAPATCPASLGDGIEFTGGSVTIRSVTGRAEGSFTGQLQGGESVSGDFTVPYASRATLASGSGRRLRRSTPPCSPR